MTMLKSFKSLLIAIVLLMISSFASAETVCSNCEYTHFGRYVGALWVGDKSTFGNRNIVAEIGPSLKFENYYVFDLNTNGAVNLVVSNRNLVQPFAVAIYMDTGSTCDIFGVVCDVATPDFNSPIIFKEAGARWSGKTQILPPGRYVVRIMVETPATGNNSSYFATMTLKVR